MKLILSVTLQLLFFIVFGRFDLTEKGIQNRNGLSFLFVTYLGFFAYNNALQIFLTEKPLFLRECLANYYTVPAYFLAK
jgi:hypothetical protein